MANSFSRIALPGQTEPELKVPRSNSFRPSEVGHHEDVLAENVFHSMLTLERRRAERSRKPFVLMLLDANLETGAADEILMQAVGVALATKRATDPVGLYRRGAIVGIIFTEVNPEGELPITETLRTKFVAAFSKHMGRDRTARIAISTH